MHARSFLVATSAALAVVCIGSSAGAVTRQEVAKKWAPLFYQETNDPLKDLLTAFDFDGDWNGDDNAENMQCWGDTTKCTSGDDPSGKCAGHKCPLVATVYYTVIETKTHWFVQYMPYHPLDWKVTNGHENDTESVLVVVDKSAGGTGKAVAMETRFHLSWYQYAASGAGVSDGADNVDGPMHFDATTGRPQVYVQMVGHGFCGGFSPPNRFFPDLSLTCNHSDTPHIDQTGVVYSPDLPATMPTIVDGKAIDAGYALVELRDSVWTHIHEIGAGKAFQDAEDFKGERCAMGAGSDAGSDAGLTCPTGYGGNWEGNEGTSPGEPWAQEGGNGVSATGDQFFDPAYTMSKRLTFAGAFSLEYCFDPYVGIDVPCDGTTPDDAGSDAGVDATGDAIVDARTDGPTTSDSGAASDSTSETSSIDSGAPSDGSTSSSGGCGCTIVGDARAPRDAAFVLVFAAICCARRRARRLQK